MILKLEEKKKENLNDLIYLIKRKLKKQLKILIMIWMKLLKNFIIIKRAKKKTMALKDRPLSFILSNVLFSLNLYFQFVLIITH